MQEGALFSQYLQIDPVNGPVNPFIITAASFSILGSIFNITATLCLKAHRLTIGKMVLILSSMDLIANMTNLLLMIPTTSEFQCRLMSLLQGFGYSESVYWTNCFAYSLILAAKYGDLNVISANFRRYIILSLIWGILLSIASAGLSYVQPIEGYCWHSFTKNPEWYNIGSFLLFTLPFLFCILFCGYCYIWAYKEFKRSSLESHYELTFYPLILIVCYLPFTLAAFAALFTHDVTPAPWDLMIMIMINLQGFFNSIAYGLSGTINSFCRKRCLKSSRSSDSLIEESEHNNGLRVTKGNFSFDSSNVNSVKESTVNL